MDRVEIPSQSRHWARDVGAFPASGLLSHVSIVIPVAPDDDAWETLLRDLAAAGTDAELLLIGARNELYERGATPAHSGMLRSIRWLTTTAGRARQMNWGATHATRAFVWFLHADSRVTVDALVALEKSLEAHPHALNYFDLRFQDDGPGFVRLNAMGAHVRARYLGLPFGDQGLCMSRETFGRLGGFDEAATYGEDHLLLWAAHRQGVPLERVGAYITTSARKYRTNGWFRTTLVHGWRTWRQAVPQLIRCLWTRCG